MSFFPLRTLGEVNELDSPVEFQEIILMSSQRANFADALLHQKPSILRRYKSPKEAHGSPTNTYSSFDSLSVVLEHIPRELPKAGAVGIGAKGDFEMLNDNLEAPAYVLANLIPVSAYIVKPSIEIIHAFLSRAYALPLFIITVAACMLEALSPEDFGKAWRATCPLLITFQPDEHGPFGSSSRDPHTLRLHDLPLHDRHVTPEIIVLAALALADVFSPYDIDLGDRYWVGDIAHGRYTQAQLNATKRCILRDLDHALMPFTEKSINRAMVREMAKWQYKLREIEVEQIKRDLGTWGSPSRRASPEGRLRQSNYQHPTVTSAASSSLYSTSLPSTSLPSTSLSSTSLPSTSLPSTSLPSTSLPSTSLPSTSAASTSAVVALLTQANLRRHDASLRVEDWEEGREEDCVEWVEELVTARW